MRSKYAKINITINFISNILLIIIVFFSQKAIISTLGEDYLGINGLFSNIISMLSIAELGFGAAVVYNLYKPIAVNDIETIKSLMVFYKKCYRAVAAAILLIGLALLPVIPHIVGEVSIQDNIYLIYCIFILDSVSSYLLSYKQSIINAHQKEYITKIFVLGYQVLSKSLQIAVLYLGGSYYLFLLVSVVLRFADNFIIKLIAEKMYPYIRDHNIKPLPQHIKKDINTKIKALFFHKIGAFTVTGSDSIIVSALFNVSAVGYYSNYRLIIVNLQNIMEQALASITSSVGNLLATEDRDYSFQIFKKVRFLNLWLSIFISICIYTIMDSWIVVWIGAKWVMPHGFLLTLCINFFFQSMRCSMNIFKGAAGIWYEDRFIPLIETVVNIVISVIFGKLIGIAGVFIGTILSGLVLHLYSYPKYAYTKIFERKYLEYYRMLFKELVVYAICFISVVLVNGFIFSVIPIDQPFILFAAKTVLNVVLTNLILIAIFFRSEEFIYYRKKILK